ncbi:hypothetical protein FM112_09025 [Gulosibacter sp. 10]|nr:hypothetical protein FM112_09025 [Gulosibacter sp. 10]
MGPGHAGGAAWSCGSRRARAGWHRTVRSAPPGRAGGAWSCGWRRIWIGCRRDCDE